MREIAVSQTGQAQDGAVKSVQSILDEAMSGLRESGRDDAVLELRTGLHTDYGERYVAYLRNERNTFDHIMFSIFVDQPKATYGFQADGKTTTYLNQSELEHSVREYILRPAHVKFFVGLLDQFRPKHVVVASARATAAETHHSAEGTL